MSQENIPGSYEHFALWEAELPSEVCTGYSEETNPLDALLRTELDEADRNFHQLHQGLEVLDMLDSSEVYHSYGTQEGFVRVASSQVPFSNRYHWDHCLHLVVNAQTNDVFSSALRNHIAIEDYFLDFEHGRLAVRKGSVMLEGPFVLPEKTPSVVRASPEGGRALCHGVGYELPVPDYDSPLDIPAAQWLKVASGKLLRLIGGLSEATLDCKK